MDTPDGTVREVALEAEFEALRTAGTGWFVVTDRSTPTRIHNVSCYAVGLPHFRTKVITNARRRGRYYFAPAIGGAIARFPKGLPCGLCRPFPPAPRTPPTPPAPLTR